MNRLNMIVVLLMRAALLAVGASLLTACDFGSGDNGNVEVDDSKSTGSFLVPTRVRTSTLDKSKMTAYIRIDDNERQAMTIDEGGAQASFVSGKLKKGEHTFTIEFEFEESGTTYVLTTGSKSFYVAKGDNTLQFNDADFTNFPDDDNDSFSNLDELEGGSDPKMVESKPLTQVYLSVKLPLHLAISGIDPSTVTATVSIAGGDPVAMNYNVNKNLFELTIPEALSGTRDYEFNFSYKSESYGTLNLANRVTQFTAQLADNTTTITVEGDQYDYDDADNDNSHTIMELDLGSDPTSAEATPGKLVFSSFPSENVRGSVWGDVIIYLGSGDIDPSSVNNDTVKLLFKGEVKGSVSYSESDRTITFDPDSPLLYNFTYSLVLSQIKNQSGTAYEDAELSVSTYRNRETKSTTLLEDCTQGEGAVTPMGCVLYQSASEYNEWGYRVFSSYFDAFQSDNIFYESDSYDDNGKHTLYQIYDGPGPDAVWITEDDLIREYSQYHIDANGNMTRRDIQVTAGADNVFHTADDVPMSYTTYSYDSNGKITEQIDYNSAGEDGVWYNGDDIANAAERNTYDANNNLLKRVIYSGAPIEANLSGYNLWEYNEDGVQTLAATFSGPGPDTIWFTNDDDGTSYVVNEFNENGGRTYIRRYNSPGADLDWTALDDNGVSEYTRYEYDANGNLLYQIRHIGPGVDTQWFTADDEAFNFSRNVFDNAGQRIRYVSYNGAGADGLWTTQDDLVSNFYIYLYNAAGRRTSSVYFSSAGADNTIGTSDDVTTGYSVSVYDDNDHRIQSISYNGAGADTLWLTDDDVISSYANYTFNEKGRITQQINYNGPGPDDQWFNDNDDVSSYVTYVFDANDNQIMRTNYVAIGDDAKWFTSDDVPSQHSVYEYNAQNQLTRRTTFSGPGTDGKWLTPDDAGNSRAYILNEHGSILRETYYSGPGADDIWFNGDDFVTNYTVYSYDSETGNRIKYERTRAGADGIAESGDDFTETITEYDIRF